MKRLICGDNLAVLRSDAIDTASVDLVYLDPPFNSKSVYNLPFQKLGKDVAAVEAFTDIWSWDEETKQLQGKLKDNPKTFGLWNYVQHVKIIRRGEDSLSAYLVNMAVRLHELPRVMKSDATLFLHCDPTASHYLKLLLDGIFGPLHFQNEIIWKRTTAHSDSLTLGNTHDTILLYSKGDKFKWNKQYSAYDEKYEARFRFHDPDGRRWMDDNLTAKGLSGGGYDYEYKGCHSYWRLPPKSMEQLDREGRLHFTKNGGIRLKRYLDEAKGLALQDVWTDISPINSQAEERLGYPTQKPVALLERIIAAS